jgi:hypothetical protein
MPLVATMMKDLRGKESEALWSSIRGGKRAGRPHAVIEAADFLYKRQ